MRHHLKLTAVIMAILIVTLPICFATEINLQYDSNGNLIGGGDGLTREYNSLNQLSKVKNSTTNVTLQEYTYDPIEERVAIKKDYVNNETTYYFTQNNVRVVKFNGSVYNYKYVYHEGQLIAQVNPDGSKYYIHGNHEGSSSVVTNQSGAVIENTSYSPTGDILSGGTKTRYNSEGKEYDSVIKSTDFNFRQMGIYGAPVFQSPDTLIQNVYDPQSLNRYAFERNNPYRYTDPSGHNNGPLFNSNAQGTPADLIDFMTRMEYMVANYLTDGEAFRGEKIPVYGVGEVYSDEIYKYINIDSSTASVMHAANPSGIIEKPKSVWSAGKKEKPAIINDEGIKIPYNQENLRITISTTKTLTISADYINKGIGNSKGSISSYDRINSKDYAGQKGNKYVIITRAKTGKSEIVARW